MFEFDLNHQIHWNAHNKERTDRGIFNMKVRQRMSGYCWDPFYMFFCANLGETANTWLKWSSLMTLPQYFTSKAQFLMSQQCCLQYAWVCEWGEWFWRLNILAICWNRLIANFVIIIVAKIFCTWVVIWIQRRLLVRKLFTHIHSERKSHFAVKW